MTQSNTLEGWNGTPEDWFVVPYGDGDSLVIHSDDDNRVCFMATRGSSPGAMTRIKAHAALIVAAKPLALLVQKLVQTECYSPEEWAEAMAGLQKEGAEILHQITGEQP